MSYPGQKELMQVPNFSCFKIFNLPASHGGSEGELFSKVNLSLFD